MLPNLIVLAMRMRSVFAGGMFEETTGTERVPIYSVWKAAFAHPLYERPFTDNFSPSIYNFLFYKTYGALAHAAHWNGADFAAGCRFLTALFTLAGAAVFTATVFQERHDPVSKALWIPLAALAVWFSSGGVSWFYLTVRPDMLSLLFASVGVWLYLRCLRTRTKTLASLSGIAFSAAWACKQSTIGMFVGVCLYQLSRMITDKREPRAAILLESVFLIAPVVIVAALSWTIGGAEYRFSTVTIPALAKFTHVQNAFTYIVRVFGANPVVVAVPVAALVAFIIRHPHPSAETSTLDGRLLALSSAVALSWFVAFVALMRDGGYRNSLLEAYVATSLLAMFVAPWAVSLGRRYKTCAVFLGVAALASALYPVLQMAFPGRLGTLEVSPPEKLAEGRAIVQALGAVPKPLFGEDYLFAEPWYATENTYPSVVFDPYLYHQAKLAGAFRSGIESLIERRAFRSLLMTGGLKLEDAARSAGYVEQPLPPHPSWDLTLYVLSPEVAER